jgi:hypothetical protein
MDSSGVPSGSGSTRIVPWPPASWGPKVRRIRAGDRAAEADVPDGRTGHVEVPVKPCGDR